MPIDLKRFDTVSFQQVDKLLSLLDRLYTNKIKLEHRGLSQVFCEFHSYDTMIPTVSNIQPAIVDLYPMGPVQSKFPCTKYRAQQTLSLIHI